MAVRREELEEIRRQLVAPGQPFEIVEEEVLGERMEVFRSRLRSLRELLNNAAGFGDAEYLVHGERRYSYAQHAALVAATARVLWDRYGVRPGDRVAIVAENRAEWVLAFWAAVSIGGVVAALNGWWAGPEIEYGIEHSAPRVLIGDEKRLARLRRDPGVPVLRMEDEFWRLVDAAAGSGLPEVSIGEDDPAVILYTSGTTGRPKGALCSHRGIIGFVQTNVFRGLEHMLIAQRRGRAPEPNAPRTCFLVTVPLFHMSGLFTAVVMGLAVGAKVVLRSGRFDPEDVLRLIEKERVTSWSALGNTAQLVISHPALGRYDTSSLRNIGFGGAPTSPALQQRIRESFPTAAAGLGMGYGLSESVAAATTITGEELEERPTSVGRPLPTTQIEIRDEADHALPEGAEGEIHIRSPYLMLGYWRDPEATAKVLKPGRWLASGDIGRMEEGYLYVNSRARDLILRGAENVYPVEIEQRLEAHPAVREVAVVGVEHEVLGQEVKAIVVPQPGTRVTVEELRAWCAEALAPFKVPAHWEIRTEPLPRNAAGKVLKNVLAGEARNQFVED